MLPFFNEEELLRAKDIIRDKTKLPRVAIITWQGQFLEIAKKKYKVKECATFNCGLPVSVYTIEAARQSMVIVNLPIGGPVVAGFVEEFAIRGVQTFIAIGYAASMSPLTQGNLIVPDFAYRDEGVSWHYEKHDDPWIRIRTAQELDEILLEMNVPHIVGRVWTTDAFYRETPSAVKMMKAQRCLCVDMECASLMSVCQYRDLQGYQMLFGADSLEGESWNIGKLKSHKASTYEMYLEVALAVAQRLN